MQVHLIALICCLTLSTITNATDSASKQQTRAFEQYALTHSGDAERGRKLYLQEKVARCAVCHQVENQGGQVGPDLSSIGGKFDRPHLIESLLFPSQQIVEGYQSVVIVTTDGTSLTGVLKERSSDALTLLDSDGKQHTIRLDEIELRQDRAVSLMPTGLAEQLTPAEFTDLIAYLETLGPGGQAKFGAGVSGPIQIPDGYDVDVLVTGIDGATALETLPDGRILVCEQTGKVRVIENGQLLEEPFVTLPVDSSWERGVIGVTVDPDFPAEPFVYVCWVAKDPYPHHRVSRFRAAGNEAVPGSEEVLLRGDDQTKMGGNVPNGHQGGGLHFGNDGCLYIGIGEQTAGEPAQSLETFLGKILRINRDGSIPADNPLLDQTSGKYQAIWAYGCRNPFTFAIRNSDGLMLINDVGGKFEEINVGRAGSNYGWPVVDHGPRSSDQPYQGPLYWYPQASISGADFAPDQSTVPQRFQGKFFFADFVHGWIHVLDPNAPGEAQEFAGGLRRPVDLRFNDQGELFVLLRNAWVIDGKFEGGTGSLLRIAPTPVTQPVSAPAQTAPAAPGTDPSQAIELDEDAVDASAGDLPAFRITTPTATYYLEKSGGGLSSLIDRDGQDWIGFEPTPGSGSAGEYRGFPNAVHQQDGNYFHARNQGTGPSQTRVTKREDHHVVIEVTGENGRWRGRYDFYRDAMSFTMTKMSPGHRYWVLYEGTPGGTYDDNDWWMTSSVDQPQSMLETHEGDIPRPEWIAFGDADRNQRRSLLLIHHEDDTHPDRFYQMRNEMTVFGFGREGIDKFLDFVPQRFTISLVETSDHAELAARAAELIEQREEEKSGK